jgi:hypothetical protein
MPEYAEDYFRVIKLRCSCCVTPNLTVCFAPCMVRKWRECRAGAPPSNVSRVCGRNAKPGKSNRHNFVFGRAGLTRLEGGVLHNASRRRLALKGEACAVAAAAMTGRLLS